MDVDAVQTGEESPGSQTTASYAPDYSTNEDGAGDHTSDNNESTHVDENTESAADGRQNGEESGAHQMSVDIDDEHAQMEETRLAKLEAARNALKQPDAILEADVFANIKTMFDSGGHRPQEIIKFLAGGYRGFPQMCNLVSNWLRQAKVPDSEIVSLAESHIRTEIKAKFDPIKAARIFEMGSAPSWLTEMIKHSTWRHLIYELSETNRDCLLLNYGIQKISEAGHEDEIAALPSASTYFSVFNRVLSETINKALNQPEWDLANALSDFKKMCRHSEHTFVYTQAVLHALFSTDPSGRLRRISEELSESPPFEIPVDPMSTTLIETSAEQRNEEQIQFFQSSLLYLTNLCSYASFASSYISIMKSSYPSPGDVRSIHQAYTQIPPNDSGPSSPASSSVYNRGPPPAAFLRSHQFLDKLIEALFSTQPEIPSDYLNSYVWLLAYASCSTDSRDISPSATVESALPINLVSEIELKAVSEGILKVVAVCKSTSVGLAMTSALETTLAHIEYSIVCLISLHWIRSCICDPEKIATSWGLRFLSSQLEILQEIAATHPVLQPHCTKILFDAFIVETTMDPNIASVARKKFMEYAVFLMEYGYVIPVLKKVEGLVGRVDQSLIRHFLLNTLEMAESPFSLAFIDPIARLLSNVNIDGTENRNTVLRFTQHVLKPGEYHLSPSTKESLLNTQNACSK